MLSWLRREAFYLLGENKTSSKPNQTKSHTDFDFATAKTRQRQLNTISGGEVTRKRQINCKIIAKQDGQKSAKQPSTCILRSHSYGLLPSHFLGVFHRFATLLCITTLKILLLHNSLLSLLPVFRFFCF